MVGLSWDAKSAEPFPRYKIIEPNVAFWVKVYSQYPTTRAIIHDSVDLGIIYDVIAVKPYDAPGARKINRQRTKQAKAKYKAILKRLAADPDTDHQTQHVRHMNDIEHRVRSAAGFRCG